MSDSEVKFSIEKTKYDKGENRKKHLGLTDLAEMVHTSGIWIGKCPKSFPLDLAETLLKSGVPEFRETTEDKPYRIWVYHKGAIYAARTQDGGRSWHGYPNGHPMPPPPRDILAELRKSASKTGEEKLLEQWLEKRWEKKK